MDKPILGTNILTQVGILVHDVEKAAQDYADFFGVEKPPIFQTGTLEQAQTRYMGEPTEARCKQAFFHVGPNVDIELIEPDHNPSTWRRDLDEKGEGFHHIAFVIDGMKAMNVKLEELGMPLLQKGEYPGGRYAYHDANHNLKLILELLENDKK